METLWADLQDIYYANPLGWNVVLGVLILLGAAYVPNKRDWGWLEHRPRLRGSMSLKKARRNFVRSMVIDELVNIVESKVFHEEMTRKEAREIYRDARKYWPVRDLFPSPELLKENIKDRLANTSRNLPVSLPDAKPKAKHAFDRMKA